MTGPVSGAWRVEPHNRRPGFRLRMSFRIGTAPVVELRTKATLAMPSSWTLSFWMPLSRRILRFAIHQSGKDIHQPNNQREWTRSTSEVSQAIPIPCCDRSVHVISPNTMSPDVERAVRRLGNSVPRTTWAYTLFMRGFPFIFLPIMPPWPPIMLPMSCIIGHPDSIIVIMSCILVPSSLS